jgi:hypothetical protein
MIEVTLTDMFLLGWAAVMTLFYFKKNSELNSLKMFIHILLTDKEARDRFVRMHEQHTGA